MPVPGTLKNVCADLGFDCTSVFQVNWGQFKSMNIGKLAAFSMSWWSKSVPFHFCAKLTEVWLRAVMDTVRADQADCPTLHKVNRLLPEHQHQFFSLLRIMQNRVCKSVCTWERQWQNKWGDIKNLKGSRYELLLFYFFTVPLKKYGQARNHFWCILNWNCFWPTPPPSQCELHASEADPGWVQVSPPTPISNQILSQPLFRWC